ncbi:MAG: hypothetical protein ACUVTL_01395 [Thermoproteota archaeon]
MTSIILLITSELLSPYYGRTGIVLNKRGFRLISLSMRILFLATVVVRVIEIIMGT